MPDISVSRSLETLSEAAFDDYMIVEGGPLDGLQCGEKMWIIIDAQTAPFIDIQFQVTGYSSLFYCVEIKKLKLEKLFDLQTAIIPQ